MWLVRLFKARQAQPVPQCNVYHSKMLLRGDAGLQARGASAHQRPTQFAISKFGLCHYSDQQHLPQPANGFRAAAGGKPLVLSDSLTSIAVRSVAQTHASDA